MAIYFVDPASGDDADDSERDEHTSSPAGGHEPAAPRRRAAPARQFHLQAAAAFPADLAGTPEEPIVIEPYAGPTATFDGRLVAPSFDVVPNVE